jgi:predicted RNase H-like HicB family nuclease
MSKYEKLYQHILMRQSDANVPFDGLCELLERLGFEKRVKGDHHIFSSTGVEEIINLQPRSNKAKPYQVKQVRNIILRYELRLRWFMESKYEIIIFWSEEDSAYLAEVPELPGCMADGQTYREALEKAEVIIGEWIETAKDLGRPVPAPRGRLKYA